MKRGRKSPITDEHIDFLKAWLDEERNKGKPFKWAFQALITKFEFIQKGIKVSKRACFNQFK